MSEHKWGHFRTGNDGLRDLAWHLRNLEQEPNFHWNFDEFLRERECGTCGCAMGLFLKLTHQENEDTYQVIEDHFDITENEKDFLFEEASTYGKSRRGEVTPLEVAAKIEEFLLDRSIAE